MWTSPFLEALCVKLSLCLRIFTYTSTSWCNRYSDIKWGQFSHLYTSSYVFPYTKTPCRLEWAWRSRTKSSSMSWKRTLLSLYINQQDAQNSRDYTLFSIRCSTCFGLYQSIIRSNFYKLYIAFGICRYQMRCTAYKIALEDGLI